MQAHFPRGRRTVLFVALCALSCERGARPPATKGGAESPAPATAIAQLLRQADSVFFRSSDSADVLWIAALRMADSLGDSVSMAKALTGRGFVARRRLEFAEARRLGEQALAMKLQLGMQADLSRSYNALGLLAWDEGRLSDALKQFRQAGEAARASGDAAGVAKAAINTGLVYRDLGEFAEAGESLRLGRDGAQAAGDSVSLGRALTNLASLDIALGDALSAMASLESARRLFRLASDTLGEVNALGQLATAYDLLGEPRQAFAVMDSALGIARRHHLRKEEAEDLKLMAGFYASAGDHTRALEGYAQATMATDTLDMPEERGDLFRNQAESYLALGRSDDGARLATAALEIHRAGSFRQAQLSDLVLLAELAIVRGRRSESDAHLTSARRLASDIGIDAARASVALAEARIADRLGEPARVVSVLTAARGNLEVAGAGAAAAAAALRLRAYARLGQLAAAAAAGRQAIAAVERVRGNYGSGELRTIYSSDRSGVYADLALVLLRMGRTTEAFEVSDAARGRALLDHIATARAEIASSRGTPRMLLDADRMLRTIDTLVARLRELEPKSPRERTAPAVAATRQLSDRVAEARSQYETLMARAVGDGDAMVLLGGAGRSAANVQSSLEEGEVLLEYFVTPARLLIFIVRSTGISSVSSEVSALELLSRTRLARDLMARARPDGGELPVLKGLHQLILGPVIATGALRNVHRLIIARHSVLTYLPFAALVDPATGRYLIQDLALLYVPSASALQVLRQPNRSPTSVGAAPAMAFAPFPDRLPATRGEVVSFSDAIPGARTAIGTAATEQRLRAAMEAGAIVHVATHGVMNTRNPLFSRIELTPSGSADPTDNGRLEVHELLGLHVASALVFLSGCETGVGDAWSTAFQPGEDYATLAQALLFAGAKNVIATLWRIDDEAAATLALRFYAGSKTLPVPEALAKAQRDMLATASLRAPYFWAAYEVHGGASSKEILQLSP